MDYPGWKQGLWASYGSIVRGSISKEGELDVHFDRADRASRDKKGDFMKRFASEFQKRRVPTFNKISTPVNFKLSLKEVLGEKGAELWLGMRKLLDPTRTMHRNRKFDEMGSET